MNGRGDGVPVGRKGAESLDADTHSILLTRDKSS